MLRIGEVAPLSPALPWVCATLPYVVHLDRYGVAIGLQTVDLPLVPIGRGSSSSTTSWRRAAGWPAPLRLLRAAGADVIAIGVLLAERAGWRARLGADGGLVRHVGVIPGFVRVPGGWEEVWE